MGRLVNPASRHDAEACVDGLTRTVKTTVKGKPGEMDSRCQCAAAL